MKVVRPEAHKLGSSKYLHREKCTLSAKADFGANHLEYKYLGREIGRITLAGPLPLGRQRPESGQRK